jgi:adenylate cyclase
MRLAALHCFDYEFELALPMAEKARDMAEAAGAESIRIWTYNFIGLALVGLGRTEEGYESLWRSYREALQQDLRWIAGNALNNIDSLLMFFGEARAREALANIQKLRDLRVAHWSHTIPDLGEANILYFLGDLEKGLAAGIKAVEHGSAAGNIWVRRFAEIAISRYYTELGRVDQARALMGITHDERQRDSDEAAALIRFSLCVGEVDRAVEGARFLLEIDEGAVGSVYAAELGIEGLLAGGAVEDARTLLRGFDRRPWLERTPFVMRARARVALADGQLDESRRLAQAVLDLFVAGGYRLDEARTLILLARTAIASDDPDEAKTRLRAAAKVADEVGSVAIGRESRAVMAELGEELDERVPLPAERVDEVPPGERLVTVLFADVRGYTALAGAAAPADLADRISALQRWALGEVERHHGVLDKFAGDALMATFNVSGASVDHALHALQTAFAIRDKSAMLSLPVGVGVATGSAVVGRMARGANLSVLGEATNLASRLQSKAAAGEILLSDESHRRVREWLAERGLATDPVALTLKGIEGQVSAFRLRAPVEVAPAG